MNVKVVYHYCKDDPDFSSDHASIEVFVDGEKVTEFDHRHGSLQECEGFISGLRYCHPDLELERENLADVYC